MRAGLAFLPIRDLEDILVLARRDRHDDVPDLSSANMGCGHAFTVGTDVALRHSQETASIAERVSCRFWRNEALARKFARDDFGQLVTLRRR